MSEVEARASGRWLALEVAVAFLTSAVFFATCFTIHVKVLERTGQVSGLASLGLRFTIAATVLVVTLIAAARWRSGAHFDRVSALVCAAAAGLVSGMVAGGILVALRGCPWGLGGETGDTWVLADWAHRLQAGEPPPGVYPPLHVYGVAWLSDLFRLPTLYAMKHFQLLGLLIVTPVAYSAWRLLLRPVWALGIGVTISLPFIEAYRLYPFVVLLAFLPLSIRFLDTLRFAGTRDPLWLARRAIWFGLGFGVLFLLYSGWYQWSAPGFIVAALVVFPWRTAPRRGALFCAVGALIFAILCLEYLTAIANAPKLSDAFLYFDATVDPAYISMWRGDLPGAHAALWPPLGELGGVGVFTLLLGVGFGAAVALGRRTTAVISLSAIMVGAWLVRFWYAHAMSDTGLVQLYPRTTAELLYCFLAMSGLAVHYAARRRQLVARPPAIIGVVCGLLFIYGQAGSAISDKYMPRESETDYGRLAWQAQKTPREGENQARDAVLGPTESVEDGTYSAAHLFDNKPATLFSTEVKQDPDHDVILEIRLPRVRMFSKLVLYPASDGFPVDFDVDVNDSVQWITRVHRTNVSQPSAPIELQLVPDGEMDQTALVRVHVTKLGKVAGGYGVRLGEIMLFR